MANPSYAYASLQTHAESMPRERELPYITSIADSFHEIADDAILTHGPELALYTFLNALIDQFEAHSITKDEMIEAAEKFIRQKLPWIPSDEIKHEVVPISEIVDYDKKVDFLKDNDYYAKG